MFKRVTKNATRKNNIKVHLKDMEMEKVDCIHLVENREEWQALLSNRKNAWVLQNAEDKLTSMAINRFSVFCGDYS
jgi:hypothetical protein